MVVGIPCLAEVAAAVRIYLSSGYPDLFLSLLPGCGEPNLNKEGSGEKPLTGERFSLLVFQVTG
jgi:hypothetical protein